MKIKTNWSKYEPFWCGNRNELF